MHWVVTGGSGFIGTNLVTRLVTFGHKVTIIDDLSRAGSELNAEQVSQEFGLHPNVVDISHWNDLDGFISSLKTVDVVAHLAGQVSLLSSINDPRRDFEVNALGTLNILEWIRRDWPEACVMALSSNKVYGDLDDIRWEETATRYFAPDFALGFDEGLPLDFRGPYGCSKGTADQYVRDFGRIFGLRTISLRQSSVYGTHQHPRSDQGWVGHLVEETLAGREIRLNGVGKQVRDLLYAEDLAELLMTIPDYAAAGSGDAFNVGGGPAQSLSILELFQHLERDHDCEVRYSCGESRPSDQKAFISNNAAITEFCGWRPSTSIEAGLQIVVDQARDRVRAQ